LGGKKNKEDIAKVMQLCEVFTVIDVDNSGDISWQEFTSYHSKKKRKKKRKEKKEKRKKKKEKRKKKKEKRKKKKQKKKNKKQKKKNKKQKTKKKKEKTKKGKKKKRTVVRQAASLGIRPAYQCAELMIFICFLLLFLFSLKSKSIHFRKEIDDKLDM
jgi:chemotaxis protein histidine kinase CheA